jgi:hypothetical protein
MSARKYFVWAERLFLLAVVLFTVAALSSGTLTPLALIYSIAIVVAGTLGLVLLK